MTVLPANVLDLHNWKLNDCNDDGTGQPLQVLQPALATFTDSCFSAKTNGVVFMAPVGGLVQAGAKYPRSELREMLGTLGEAGWDTTLGVHTMTLAGRADTLPPVKPEIVVGQIHDANARLMLWLSGLTNPGKLTLSVWLDGTLYPIEPNYVLGTTYVVQLVASNGQVQVAYNGSVVLTLPLLASGCYFKAGCYTQSNPSMGDLPTSFGRAVISALSVTHY